MDAGEDVRRREVHPRLRLARESHHGHEVAPPPPDRDRSLARHAARQGLLSSVVVTLRPSVVVVGCLGLALAGCGGGGGSGVPDGAPKELSSLSAEWPAPNQNLANTRVASSKIDSGNVDQLGIAWTVPIKGGGTFGNYASTPIIADGVVYTQDLTSNVKAIDLETGDVKWSRDYDSRRCRAERRCARLQQDLRGDVGLRLRARQATPAPRCGARRS